jgi:hypothetical protein
MSSVDIGGKPMYVTPSCPHCGTPATGTRFCTTCGSSAPASDHLHVAGTLAGEPAAAPDDTRVGLQPETPHSTSAYPQGTSGVTMPAAGWSPTAVLAQEHVDTGTATATAPWLSGESVHRPPRKRPDVLALLIAGALLLSVWAFVRGIEEHTLSGTVTLVDSSFSGSDPGDSCIGENGYGDIRGGAQVVITDSAGETLSTGRLSAGEFDGLGCVFSFALEDVTRTAFYSLSVAGDNRGELQYSYDELADDDWSVQLSLGDI